MSMQTPLESDPQPIVPITQSHRRLIRSVSVGKSLITSPPKQELSSQGTVFFSPTNASPIKSRLPIVPYRDANGEIVDFHDKTQVYKLIASVNEKAEKIKIIDLVRKRREEMDSAKKKRKKQKALTNVFGSVHSPFDSEFQPTHTINRFRKSLKEIYSNEKSLTIIPTCSNSTADNTPLVRQSQKPKTLVIVNKNRIEFTESDDSERSEIQGIRLVFPVVDNEKTPSIQSPKTVSRSSLSSGTGFRFGNQNTAFGETTNLLNKTAGYDNSASQRRRLNKKLEVKFGSIGEFRKPPESLSVDSSSPAKSTLSGFSKRTENIDTEAKPINHDRDNDMYVLGRSKLEKDIFKYLMKSKEGKDNNLVLGLAPQKEEKLRNIETGALIQYVQAHPFEDLTYIPNNLLKIKKHKIEKAKAQAILNGSNKRPVVQIKQRPDPKGCLMRIDQGARSSSFIRKVDSTQVFCDEFPKPKGAIKGRKIDLNDSLVSHTETRLDCLYKEVRQMNKAIKRIEDKIDMSKSQQESKSLLRMKELKLKDYSEHSAKIKILIKKKVTDVYS